MKRTTKKSLLLAVCLTVAGLLWFEQRPVIAQTVTRFLGATSSQPLALTADDAFLAVVNPDNNSVSFFDIRLDRLRLLATRHSAPPTVRRGPACGAATARWHRWH